jgi:hypothetical protein
MVNGQVVDMGGNHRFPQVMTYRAIGSGIHN